MTYRLAADQRLQIRRTFAITVCGTKEPAAPVAVVSEIDGSTAESMLIKSGQEFKTADVFIPSVGDSLLPAAAFSVTLYEDKTSTSKSSL